MLARYATIGLGVIAWCSSPAHAYRDNPPAGRNGSTASGGATCRSCHGSTVGTGAVTILGVPAQYTGSGVYDLTVRVSDPTKLGAGFQLSAEDAVGGHVGTLSVIDSINTQLNADNPHWVNHTLTGVNNSVANWAAMGNAAEFTVRWQAPAINAGPVTFWAVGNAINNNGSLTGDLVYLTSTTAASGLVPAVSTWGLAVLTLAMLAAGAATLKRGAPAASFEPAGC